MNTRIQNFVICSFLLLFFASCSLQTSPNKCVNIESDIEDLAFKKLEPFMVEAIDIDYIAKCKARIIADKKSFSGSCKLVLTRNHELQLTILHPLGGTLLQIYADQRIIQVSDYTAKRFYELPANETDKLDLPILKHLTIEELQSILWGRLTENTVESLEYELEGGKPKTMYKRNGDLDLKINYSRWLKYNSLLFPRTININDQKKGSSLRLAITNFKPGYACNLTISNHFAVKP